MVSIILPTYNEQANIVPLIKAIESGLTGHELEFINIDDNSPDRTYEAVKKYASTNSNVTAILRENERGFRSALQRGIDFSKGDIIVWLDCDFSHPPDLIPGMIEEIENNNIDAVVPSRFIPGSKDNTVTDAPLAVRLQKLLSLGLNRICSRIIDLDFHDWTSGFIAVRSELIKNHRLKGDFCEYYMELISHLIRQKAHILEIPYTSPPRRAGETKSAPSLIRLFTQGIKYIRMLNIILRQKREHAQAS